ncbi:MAG: AraC family transcriptional regulator [Sulfurimonas sp.]|nr:MAG: AraC family transcriptional regulator [Sulfurimonas sp.]
MDSFFFNITDTSYKVSYLYKEKKNYIKRVDISNGIVFFDVYIYSKQTKIFKLKNLDRMVIITVTKQGSFFIHDNINKKIYNLKKNSINILNSSRQDLSISLKESEKTEIFVLFIADFILKRHLSSNQNEVINFLYNNIQGDVSCDFIDTKPIDALSLYIINKILDSKSEDTMASIRCEHNILEFMIHRFNLLDILDDKLKDDEIRISKSAKNILLSSYVKPPSIKVLAHLCATNETKLKKVFKKVYNTTIYAYIQKLRLEKANLLLKDQILNIGEISKEVGYKHQGHFSKLFFQYYAVYPKDLLKK